MRPIRRRRAPASEQVFRGNNGNESHKERKRTPKESSHNKTINGSRFAVIAEEDEDSSNGKTDNPSDSSNQQSDAQETQRNDNLSRKGKNISPAGINSKTLKDNNSEG